jgi:hypothetical protein
MHRTLLQNALLALEKSIPSSTMIKISSSQGCNYKLVEFAKGTTIAPIILFRSLFLILNSDSYEFLLKLTSQSDATVFQASAPSKPAPYQTKFHHHDHHHNTTLHHHH